MKNKLLLTVVSAVSLAGSLNISAAIIDNGSYTTDTVSGLDWLDLTETTNMSYNDVTAQLGAGGALEGWRYATKADVIGFFDAFGGGNTNYNWGWSEAYNGLFASVSMLWGDTSCAELGCNTGEGYSQFMYDGLWASATQTTIGTIGDWADDPRSLTRDYVSIESGISTYISSYSAGAALIRDVSPVPVPAAVWLFGSGLLGLIGVARRKRRA